MMTLFISSAAALLATCMWLAKRNHGVTYLANIAEGTHANSIARLTDSAVGSRYLLAKVGTDAAHADLAGASDIPLGVFTDEATTAESPLTIELFGVGERTLLGVASAAIAAGALLVPAAGGKLRTLPTASGTYYIVGRSLGVASADGDTVEFVPSFPVQRVIS
jgi:hypothetical protein